MIPNIGKCNFFLVRRMPSESKILFYTPAGDSYLLSAEESRMLLRLQGYEDVESTVDYIWNFYTVAIDISKQRRAWIPLDDLKAVVKQLRETPALDTAVIGDLA